MNFDFSVFVLNDDAVLKVGSICFVDSCSFPFIISRIFKSSLGGSAFLSGVRCHCEGGKVISVLHNFQLTVDCWFVRPCSSAEFCLSSVSSEVCNFVFHSQTSVFFISRKKLWKFSISGRAASPCLGGSDHGCHRSGNSQEKKNSSRSGKSQGISL